MIKFKVGDRVFDSNPVNYGDCGTITKFWEANGVPYFYYIQWTSGEWTGHETSHNSEYFKWLQPEQKYKNILTIQEYLGIEDEV